jgi:nucleoside phosphorylase
MNRGDVHVFSTEPSPEGGIATRDAGASVDVLILTALEHELDAVLALADDGWINRHDLAGFPYHRRSFERGEGRRPLVVAAAWLGKMGEVETAIRGGALLRELDPACVAMCGICAGMRGEVALGDGIVGDRLYSYDSGKLVAEPGKDPVLHHDIDMNSLHPLWRMHAANLKHELDLPALQKHRPPSIEAQRRWLLHAQYAHEVEDKPPPVSLDARKTACPSWPHLIEEAKTEKEKKPLSLDSGVLALSPEGRKQVLDDRMQYPDGLPEDPDLRVHVGAVGTGKAVQKDPGLFERLRRVVKTTIGVEMEGAAIGELARHFDKRGIVVKAVSDHGDLHKDDAFRKFACRTSAEVLMVFLLKHLEPRPTPEDGDDGSDPQVEPGKRDIERWGDGFVARVERVARLREPSAGVRRRSAPSPFAGLLEVAVREGPIVDVRVIGALEQPVTEALVMQYLAEVEQPYRLANPSLGSTLVHAGEPAPADLARIAYRRGVMLKSFASYQGLLDFTRYLDRQTRWLEADPVYPPGLYVAQPARWSLAGGREKQTTEDALAASQTCSTRPTPASPWCSETSAQARRSCCTSSRDGWPRTSTRRSLCSSR